MTPTRTPPPSPPPVRPPLQRRTAAAWARVLDCGVEILEESGYEGLTIAAVCQRADVAPPAIYARVDTKEDLFLAVYEHGIARVRTTEAALETGDWDQLSPARVVERAVRTVLDQFRTHHRFLRSVVLLSSRHEEVRQRGSYYAEALRDRFVARVAPVMVGRGARTRAAAAFDVVFASGVFHTAYGDDFLHATSWQRQVVAMQQAYLLTEAAPPPSTKRTH